MAKTQMVAFRVTEQEKTELERRAQDRNMTMTQYAMDAALGRLPELESQDQHTLKAALRRIDALEADVKRLSELAFGV